MTAHDIAIYKPCAVLDRAYKDYPKEFCMVEQHAWPGAAILVGTTTLQGRRYP